VTNTRKKFFSTSTFQSSNGQSLPWAWVLFVHEERLWIKLLIFADAVIHLNQGSQTRGPRGRFVRPAMLFGNFQTIDIYIAKCLEQKFREIIESKLNDTQCGFSPGRGTTDQILPIQQIFQKSWEYAKDVYTCFVDPEKADGRFPRAKRWGVLRGNDIDGRLLLAVTSLYSCSEFCVRVGRLKSQPFAVGVGL